MAFKMIAPFFIEKDFLLYFGNAMEILNQFEENKFDLIYIDPPYFLSNVGVTFS